MSSLMVMTNDSTLMALHIIFYFRIESVRCINLDLLSDYDSKVLKQKYYAKVR